MDINTPETDAGQEIQETAPSPGQSVEKAVQSPPTVKTTKLVMSNILLIVILMLLICNLGATAFLGWQVRQVSNSGEVSEQKPLPAALSSKAERMNLYEVFRDHYNNRNNDELYEMMHPLVHVQLSEEQMEQQSEQIYDMFGDIEKGAYSHYEYAGNAKGKEVFNLYYQLKTEKMDSAVLRITVVTDRDEPMKLWGFNITGQAGPQ